MVVEQWRLELLGVFEGLSLVLEEVEFELTKTPERQGPDSALAPGPAWLGTRLAAGSRDWGWRCCGAAGAGAARAVAAGPSSLIVASEGRPDRQSSLLLSQSQKPLSESQQKAVVSKMWSLRCMAALKASRPTTFSLCALSYCQKRKPSRTDTA